MNELTWEEKVERCADRVYLTLIQKVEAQDITDYQRSAAVWVLATLLKDGSQRLIQEGEQDPKVCIGYLTGYVLGRAHQ